jgi:hypothetical protein
MRSNDPDRYAGGSVAVGRVSHSGNVKGDDADQKLLQVGCWDVGYQSELHKENLIVYKPNNRSGIDTGRNGRL